MHKVTPLPFFPLPPPTYVHPIFPLSSFSLPFGQTADMDVLGCWPSSVHLPGYSRTHTHTQHNHPITISGQTADIQMDVSGCWPSSVQCSPGKPDYSSPCYSNTYWTIQPHTTALANNTQTIIYNIYRHMPIKMTAILHTKLTIPLHSHNTFTHTHITHMHTTHTHTHTHKMYVKMGIFEFLVIVATCLKLKFGC